MRIAFAILFLLMTLAWSSGRPDSLFVAVPAQGRAMPLNSAVGVWWPQGKSPAKSVKSPSDPGAVPSGGLAGAKVVVWFHGGMTSGNCQKGFIAGDDFAKLFPDVIVVSASACRENHWATKTMLGAIDAALDSVAARRRFPVEDVSLVGVSDGALGVLLYSAYGKRRVRNRLLASSFGKLLGEARLLAGASRMRDGRWRFLQGGADRLFPPDEAKPWIEEFCREVRADCMLRFDPAGEHDWSYWREKHLDWIREAVPAGK